MTKAAAIEFSGDGVRVNGIYPGVIETPMVKRSVEASPKIMDQVRVATSIGRIGRPEETGDAAIWLCSKDASFVTGESMIIDGGYVSQ